MSSSYEFWLTDDAGRRIALLDKFAFVTYSRTVNGYGAIQLGIPYEYIRTRVPQLFRPDWRIDVWRSPGVGFPLRRDAVFILRKMAAYERTTDHVIIIEYYGRSPIDILRRQTVSGESSFWDKTDFADDMMKEIVQEWFPDLAGPLGSVPYKIDAAGTGFDPTGEFTVDSDYSLGPTITMNLFGRVVLDVLKDIKSTTFFMNRDDPVNNNKIYFDVEAAPGIENGFGFQFRTYAGGRGTDRSEGSLIFSTENGNIKDPVYYEDRLDEYNQIAVLTSPGGSASSTDRLLSRWNLCYMKQNGDQATADRLLHENRADIAMNCTFLNTPGSDLQPRSLYGVDWDLGDILPVHFVGKRMNVEVVIVHVSINDEGSENVIGQTEVNE